MNLDDEAQAYSRELHIACQLARRAGQAIMQHYAHDFDVEYKDRGASDPVTQADKDANALIVEGLAKAFPDDGILAEESPDSQRRASCKRLWCVDPLDGTREFVDRNGMFVVMIGLAVEGEARLGVVYQPTEDALYWGAGRTAALEKAGAQHALAPSRVARTQEATIVVSRSHRSDSIAQLIDTMEIPREESWGSVGLKVAQVASGRADIYISTSNRTQEWDACGPEAILRAAGGRMTDVLGDPLRYNKENVNTPRGMLATNGALHGECVAALELLAKNKGWI